jgi:hypothetical protein
MSFPSPAEFYRRYKGDPSNAREAAYQTGQELGRALKIKNNIQGEGLDAVAEILNATMRTVHGEETAKVEENKVTMRNKGFCGVMRAAINLNLPWEWIDTNFAWPWLEGIVSIIRPDIKLRIPSARCRGDKACLHVFELE